MTSGSRQWLLAIVDDDGLNSLNQIYLTRIEKPEEELQSKMKWNSNLELGDSRKSYHTLLNCSNSTSNYDQYLLFMTLPSSNREPVEKKQTIKGCLMDAF